MGETVRSLNNPLCELAECPLWDQSDGCLYWTDIPGRCLWRYDPKSGKSGPFWSGDMQVGGLCLCTDGSFLLCSDKGVFKLKGKLGLVFDVGLSRGEPFGFAQGERFNDAVADTRGRVFAGTMKETLRDGRLFRLERGREPVCVLQGLGISNGMGFSADHHFFYHTDSIPRTITRYEYDERTGEIAKGRIWYRGDERDGCPDGMTVDGEDCVWVACWGGGCVIRLDPDGKELTRIKVPALQVSALTFGGAEYKTLYITTAAKGAADSGAGMDKDGRFLGGSVYEVQCDVAGRPEGLAGF